MSYPVLPTKKVAYLKSFDFLHMTWRGLMSVQWRLLTSEEIIDKDERRMLVSTTRAVYLWMIDNRTQKSIAFFDAWALG